MGKHVAPAATPATHEQIDCRKEALKQIQEWSKGLVTIQIAAVAAVGIWFQREAGDIAYWGAIGAGVFLFASLVHGAFFFWTTIPTAIATLTQKSNAAHDDDVYLYTGGGKWTISSMARWQYALFAGSVVCFAVAAVFAAPSKKAPTEVTGRITVDMADGK
jgi:hypothetical protein